MAHNAYRYALHLAEALDTRIDLMSVYHIPVSDASRVGAHQIDEMLRERRSEVMKRLSEWAEEAPSGRIGELRVDYGMFIYQEVIDAARQGGHAMIVMGTKGERAPIEQMLGSVTTHTMMNAPCPVLAIPADARYEPIRHIAYATNFEPSDEQAVEELSALSKSLGAKVHFLHVDTRGDSGITERYAVVENYPLPFSDFSVVSNASASEGIEQFVKEHEIGLLALFLPNRRFWERLFHRSFTKRMAFHSEVPVLVFRE